MVLDNETFEKIGSLLKLPISTVQYNGAQSGNVCFLVGKTDPFKNWVFGVAIWVNGNFQVVRTERIRLIQSTGMRKKPTERVTIPIYCK